MTGVGAAIPFHRNIPAHFIPVALAAEDIIQSKDGLTVLDEPVNAYAWQNWRAKIAFPKAGYYEIWARATDSQGVSQPYAIAWNPKGYLNNSMHRIAVIIS